MQGYEFFVDPSRCIGCRACVAACAECDTHRGVSMIHVDYIDRANTIATTPMVCMHCDEPTCALVCPADAIKKGEDGIVRSALKPRCIACSNCVLACPFGVPTVPRRARADDEVRHVLRPHVGRPAPDVRDRLSEPGALVRPARRHRPRPRMASPTNEFRFGNEHVRTKVFMMAPAIGAGDRDRRRRLHGEAAR